MKKLFPLILLGLAAVVGYLYLKGGSVGSHAPTAPDINPHQVVNGVNHGVSGAKDAAAPWWSALTSQPWFYAAVVGLGLTAIAATTWSRMPGFVRGVFLVLLTIAAVVVVTGR